MSLSKTIKLTVQDYDISLSSKLKFYRGDKLKLCFEITEIGVVYNNSGTVASREVIPVLPTDGELYFEDPDLNDSIGAVCIVDNQIVFIVDSVYTQKVGTSRMQIVLKDEDGCRVALPPFEFEVRDIIFEDYNFS